MIEYRFPNCWEYGSSKLENKKKDNQTWIEHHDRAIIWKIYFHGDFVQKNTYTIRVQKRSTRITFATRTPHAYHQLFITTICDGHCNHQRNNSILMASTEMRITRNKHKTESREEPQQRLQRRTTPRDIHKTPFLVVENLFTRRNNSMVSNEESTEESATSASLLLLSSTAPRDDIVPETVPGVVVALPKNGNCFNIHGAEEATLVSTITLPHEGIMHVTQSSTKFLHAVFVKQHLFRLKKFVGDTEMEFSNCPKSVCRFMQRHMRVEDCHIEQWWELQKRVVKQTLNTHRNNIIKTIKIQYQRKCYLLSTIMLLSTD